jgi:hypothetical protein
MWQIGTLSISRKIKEQCKPQAPRLPDQEIDVRLPGFNDVFSWLAESGLNQVKGNFLIQNCN